MTIDNIDISKLKPYNKSQYQSFELLWYLICREEFKQGHFTPINDSGGGDGVEFYLTLDNGDVWGWQCKFFDRLSEKGRKNQIKASLKKACEVHGKSLKKWYLCTTSDFTPKENEWFNNTLKDIIPDDCSCLNLFHYGDSDLCSFLCMHQSIAKFFFGINQLDEGWIKSRYSKLMNREEIKEKYILDLHSETDAQGEIYFYIGGPLLGRELSKRLTDSETINNCIEEYNAGKTQQQEITLYNLDVIISVGYRVKSQRGVEFRRWATRVLKEYLVKGVAVNETRLKKLGQVVEIMRRAQHALDAAEVLSVVERYSKALDLLDDYDHQTMPRPEGSKATHVLSYEECREVIESMRFGAESNLFGNEKDDSFKGSIGNIYLTAFGEDVYPTLEEKAANLLYFITKNHSFSDGNKRIAAAIFLYFLDKNHALFNADGSKRIDDHALVALTIMILCLGKALQATISQNRVLRKRK